MEKIRNRALLFAMVVSVAGTSVSHVANAEPSLGTLTLGGWVDSLIQSGIALQIPAAQPFAPAPQPQKQLTENRIQRGISKLRSHVSASIGAQPIAVIRGKADEPNAFSSGRTLYFSQPLAKALTDAELLAVVAHEIAHAELGHPSERILFPFSAALLHFGNLLVSDWNALSSGEIDAYLEQVLKQGQVSMIQTSLDEATLGQEMEADALASKWLRTLQRKGFGNAPKDLITAFEKLTGTSAKYLINDPFFRARIAEINSH